MASAAVLRCEEFKLPSGGEITTYPPEAQQLYAAGLQAIDRSDYTNAYENMSKAAQLVPSAVRLNMVASALALKQGRSKPASEARNYYETAVTCYKSILRQQGLDDDLRRDVQNRLKVALDERDNLAQRDARREALGGQFVLGLNREYAPPTPRAAKSTPGKGPAAPAAAPAAAQAGYPQGAYQAGTNPAYGAAAQPQGYPAVQTPPPSYFGTQPSFPQGQPLPALPGATPPSAPPSNGGIPVAI